MGLGCAPVAPGTFGSLGAIVIALAVWGINVSGGASPLALNVAWGVLTLLACVGCVKWGRWAVEHFPSSGAKRGDPGAVVIDEWAGQWLALVGLAMPTFHRALAVLAVQFFLFRSFDVIKPPPARRLEKLPAGWGILSDDLAAAVYANVVGQILFRLVLD